MVQIIKEILPQKKRSFMDKLGGTLGKAADVISEYMMQQEQKKAQEMKTQQENSMIKQLTGMDLSEVRDPKMRQKAFEIAMQGQQKEKDFGREAEFKNQQQEQLQQFQKQQQENAQRFQQSLTAQQAENSFNKSQDLQFQKFEQAKELEGIRQQGKTQKKSQEKVKDIGHLRSGMKAIQTMKELRKKGNLGVGASYSPFPSTREDAYKYAQLGKSLISLASSIPIRNQREFDVLAHDLYDPGLTDAAAKGVLDAVEQIIQNGIDEAEGKGTAQGKAQNEDQKILAIIDSLSDEEIKNLVEETNGDLNKGKKLAMQRYGK